jgi:hypothetical protein
VAQRIAGHADSRTTKLPWHPKYLSHAFGSLGKPWKPGYLRSAYGAICCHRFNPPNQPRTSSWPRSSAKNPSGPMPACPSGRAIRIFTFDSPEASV